MTASVAWLLWELVKYTRLRIIRAFLMSDEKYLTCHDQTVTETHMVDICYPNCLVCVVPNV